MPGIYIHVPFCDGKCPYCDFYSLSGDAALMDRYVDAVCKALERRTREHGRESAQTVYFGGGTPNLLGAERLMALLHQIARTRDLDAAAEITLEANPTQVDKAFFQAVRHAGFNRLSMGMQSADPAQLRLLGRKHSAQDVEQAVKAARDASFENISLDLMLGLPGGGKESLAQSIDFCAALEPEHISTYLLKIEPDTPFAKRELPLPTDDEAAEEYLFCVEELAKRGYAQYEISNFAKPGKESRHNLVYWHCEEYLGFGPGAHSFYAGKRFYYPRDLNAFLQGCDSIQDGAGGGFPEYAMLHLRLTEGLKLEACKTRFPSDGEANFRKLLQNAKNCPPQLLRADSETINFTPEGFLVSNSLLMRLLDGVE